MDFENTIELLEAEIDSLKDAYKTEPNQEKSTVYSSRILEYKKAITLLKKAQSLQLLQPDVISSLKFKLEVNAGRLCEPILQAGKNPKDDAECHKAFLMLAHLEAIEDYLNCL
jgi:hypothetical protein